MHVGLYRTSCLAGIIQTAVATLQCWWTFVLLGHCSRASEILLRMSTSEDESHSLLVEIHQALKEVRSSQKRQLEQQEDAIRRLVAVSYLS